MTTFRIFDAKDAAGQTVRVFATDEATLTAAADALTVEGYALVYGVNSTPFSDGSSVRLLPGAAIFRPDLVALYAHDPNAILGAAANKTLSVTRDDRGEKVRIKLPDTTLGRDTFTLIKDGYVRGMSFEMRNWTSTYKTENGKPVELVSKFDVGEVTVTPYPRFPQTTIGPAAKADAAGVSARAARARSDLNRHRLHLFSLGT